MSDIAQAREENREMFERFAREGDVIDQASLVGLRLDVLTEMLWPQGSAFREAFETAFEMNLNARLHEIDGERTKARLLKGVRK